MLDLERLPESVLAKRNLPLKPHPIPIVGKYVKMLPFDLERDAPVLYRITNGQPYKIGDRCKEEYDSIKELWLYSIYGPFFSYEEFYQYYKSVLELPNTLLYIIFDNSTNHQIGTYGYKNNQPENLVVELGFALICSLFQGTKAFTESVYLLANNAFELGYRRVEASTNALNARSMNFNKKFGFVEEIRMNKFLIGMNNRTVDFVFFSVLDFEFSRWKKIFEEKL